MLPAVFRVRVLALLLLLAATARAGSSRLLLVDPDPELEQAVRATLSAWNTTVLADRIAGPGNTLPGSAAQARALARGREVSAVVWVSRSEDGFALWMYDVRRDRVAARPLSVAPPFDGASAASIALSVKTLLRQSDVPPPAERLQEPETERRLRLSVLGGVRPRGSTPGAPEPRFGASLGVWPLTLQSKLKLGAAVELLSGPSSRVEVAGFEGRFGQTELLVALQVRLTLARRFDLTLAPGAGLDRTRLEGGRNEPPGNALSVRVNALVSFHSELGYRLSPRLRPALRLGVVRPLRTQAYFLHGERVLEAESIRLQGFLVLEASLL